MINVNSGTKNNLRMLRGIIFIAVFVLSCNGTQETKQKSYTCNCTNAEGTVESSVEANEVLKAQKLCTAKGAEYKLRRCEVNK